MKSNLSDNDLIFENYSKTKKVIKEAGDPSFSKFVKKISNNPDEKKEVTIGREIKLTLKKWMRYHNGTVFHVSEAGELDRVIELADDLIALHSGEAVVQPGTGDALVKSGSVL